MDANEIHPLPTMAWSDAFLLGYPAMDATHREFVDCVAALQTAADDDIERCLDEFLQHALSHFGEEQRWMDASKFPASKCHAEEHDKVLSSVREVIELMQRGVNKQVARDLAEALVQWFPGHADYMDASLSHWLSQQSHGGAPVVLRRQVTEPAQQTLPDA